MSAAGGRGGSHLDEIRLPAGAAGRLVVTNFTTVGPDPAEALRRSGTDAVVCLMQQPEIEQRYPDYVRWLTTESAARWHPVTDLGLPDAAGARAIVETVRSELDAGRGVLAHCAAGIGRAGVLATLTLVSYGVDLDEALVTVRRDRPGAGPETPSQRDGLAALAATVTSAWA